MIELPNILPGHWETSEGAVMARDTLQHSPTRAQLAHGGVSDLALANAIYMANRNDSNLTGLQTAAKQRIRWLSAQLALVNQLQSNLLRAAKITQDICDKNRLASMDQNPKGFRDMLFSAICAAEDYRATKTTGAT